MIFDVDVRGMGARVRRVLVRDLREISIIYFVRWMDVLGTLVKSQTSNENSKFFRDKMCLLYEEGGKFRVNIYYNTCRHSPALPPPRSSRASLIRIEVPKPHLSRSGISLSIPPLLARSKQNALHPANHRDYTRSRSHRVDGRTARQKSPCRVPLTR